MGIQGNKLYRTLVNFKKTADHHYGGGRLSMIKFLYYSLFRVNTFIVYEIDLQGDLPHHELEPEFKVLKPTIEELRLCRKDLNLPREFYYDELHGVKNAYLVFCGKEIAYIHWVYVKGDPNRFLLLSDDIAELNYNTTLPKFRGRNLMKKMMRYIHLDLKKQGFKRACGLANAENIAATKSAERSGFKEHSRIKTIGPFNRKISI
jgi:GNAT superfamily N-acetyltransferase